jgi:hypothetical protein
MSEANRRLESFDYILLVEEDEEIRDSALRLIRPPNCAVDVARGAEEAVAKAIQHRPQLIIAKRHESLDIDSQNPPPHSTPSLICRRARLSRKVSLVTHSDVAMTFKGRPSGSYSGPKQLILMKPEFPNQAWRKEWYAYSSPERALTFLSFFIPLWLGRPLKDSQLMDSELFQPWKRSNPSPN